VVAHRDRERVHCESCTQWRAWLDEHHESTDGVWLVSWKTATGKPRMSYEESVVEALAVGWVDSMGLTIDDDRSMLWFARRKPSSGWSRPNKQRVERLEAEGYGKHRSLFPTKGSAPAAGDEKALGVADGERAVAILAGGCFWGMEDILRAVPGVISTEVGYAGGVTSHPSYKDVCTGRTGHAEAVQVVFDPRKMTYADLLRLFFRMHDPTTLNRQSHDVGTQYRSAIFVADEEQRRIAEDIKAEVERSEKWKKPVVTEIAPASDFYAAEDDHQDYLEKHPGGYSCHYLRD